MCPLNLSALLKSRALDVYVLMPSDKSLDFDELKKDLLKMYDIQFL